MKNCKNCKKVVVEECDAELCPFELPSQCVIEEKAYPCIGFLAGKKQAEFNKKIVKFVCDLERATTCTKISDDDTCCGNLEDKIVSLSLAITTTRSNLGCEKLKIEYTPPARKIASFLTIPSSIPVSVNTYWEGFPTMGTPATCNGWDGAPTPFPLPQGIQGLGIPIISTITEIFNDIPLTEKPTIVPLVLSGQEQGIAAGTYSDAVIKVKAGKYNIGFDYYLTNTEEGTRMAFGKTGSILLFLNPVNTGHYDTDVYAAIKEVVICDREGILMGANTQGEIVFPFDTYLGIRIVNSLTILNPDQNIDYIKVNIEKLD